MLYTFSFTFSYYRRDQSPHESREAKEHLIEPCEHLAKRRLLELYRRVGYFVRGVRVEIEDKIS